ncbi:MAG: pseudouridine synthase [Planctomycetota bacterium]
MPPRNAPRPTGPNRPGGFRPAGRPPRKPLAAGRPGKPEPRPPLRSGRPLPADDGKERLQKVLAAAGLGSRRACEELITAGRVEVDRTVVSELGARVDPRSQEIRVDGERLPDPKRVVYLLNKPVGAVTTNFDPAGRPRVVDLVPGERRLFAVGRLDRMSEGLILVTNDGDLANLLAHPRYGVEKKYLVQVAGVPSAELLDKLHKGVRLAEGEVHAKRVSIRSQHKQSAVLEMVLDEGKNREIRRMLARLGHKVHQLKRVAVGGLSLGNLLPGQWRQLAWSEVEALRRDALAAVGSEPLGPPPGERGRGPRRGAGGPGRRPAGRDRAGVPQGRKPGGQSRGGPRPVGVADGERRPAGRPAGAGGQSGRPGGGAGRPGGGAGRPGGGAGRRDRDAGGGAAGRPPAGPRRRKRAGKASAWRAAKKRPGGDG